MATLGRQAQYNNIRYHYRHHRHASLPSIQLGTNNVTQHGYNNAAAYHRPTMFASAVILQNQGINGLASPGRQYNSASHQMGQ